MIGVIVAWPMGLDHFTTVLHVSWFGSPKIFHFGGPQFKASAIISMCIVMLVTYTESTADMLAVAEIVGKDLTPNEIAAGCGPTACRRFWPASPTRSRTPRMPRTSGSSA